MGSKIDPQRHLDEAARGHVLIKKKEFPSTSDPFDTWPAWWFMEIEKRGVWRDPVSKCWIVRKCAKNKDHRPFHLVAKHPGSKKRTPETLITFIASHFFDWSRYSKVEVVTTCPNRNCVNPDHIMVCLSHHRQRGT